MFEFATAGRIVFGRGKRREIPKIAREFGRRAFVVLGGSGRGGEELAEGLEAVGVSSVAFRVAAEPTTVLVDEATEIARAAGCDVVIGLGGGSVVDAAKAVAGMLGNPGRVLDYLELVGGGKPLDRPGVPYVAAPTTAGTGAEVTRNAVLDVPEHKVKASLRSNHLLPRVAVIDPEVCLSLSPEVTAYTGMDALTQLIEPFTSNAANPFTDAVCREGMALAARSLKRAYTDGSDIDAREDMSIASLFGGVALANAKLGAVHGFAGVLGGLTGRPHGAICARLLPFVIETNIAAAAREGLTETLRRYAEVARILLGDPSAGPGDAVAFVRELCETMRIPPLGGLAIDDFPRVIPFAQKASSMKGNPVVLSPDELREILARAL